MIPQLALAILIALTFPVATEAQTQRSGSAQEGTASLVEVKEDRFSGKRRVRMLPVRLAPNLEMSLTGEINTSRKPDFMEQDLGVSVTAEFTTPYRGGVKFDYDMEFGFLVDSKRMTSRTSPARTVFEPYANRETEKQKAIAVLSQSTLERIAAGRKVEMKLGETEVMLDERALKSIRAFLAALRR